MLNFITRKLCLSRIVLFVTLFFINGITKAYDFSASITPESVTFSTTESAVVNISLSVVKVSGSDDIYVSSGQKNIVWSLDDGVEDGRYKYEVILSNVAAGSSKRNNLSDVTPKVMKRSGSLLIQSGKFVLPQTEAEVGYSFSSTSIFASVLDFLIPAAHAQEVISNALIVEGSTCVGVDCVIGEVFSFDSLRLKENNIQIHFDDTSSSASFPSNDWRILINESANGGNSFFGIEDSTAGAIPFYIEAGAQDNALYLDANGRVGFGTSTPATSLESRIGSTPTLRLNQDSSLGFEPQVWDIGGNELGFFVSNISASSVTPMFIGTGAPNNALYIDDSGNVGIGTDRPTQSLHVVGNAVISGNLEIASSREIKHAIKNLGLNEALSALLSLQPVSYRYNHLPEQKTLGFIAEDMPDLVATEKRKSLKPMDIIAVLTKVVQAQQEQIQTLGEKVEQLSAQAE